MGRSADRCHAGDSSPLRRHEVSGSLEPVKTFPIEARELLGVQHGLISLEQCRGIELDDAHVKALVRSGRWERVAPAVYASPGHLQTWNRSLWLAHLHAGPDSVVSHQSAGRLVRPHPGSGGHRQPHGQQQLSAWPGGDEMASWR